MKAKVSEYIEKNHRASPIIKKLSDAQRLLARYIQMFERDEIDDSKLRSLSYACKTYAEISKINYLEDIENRIEAIEKAQNEKRND